MISIIYVAQLRADHEMNIQHLHIYNTLYAVSYVLFEAIPSVHTCCKNLCANQNTLIKQLDISINTFIPQIKEQYTVINGAVLFRCIPTVLYNFPLECSKLVVMIKLISNSIHNYITMQLISQLSVRFHWKLSSNNYNKPHDQCPYNYLQLYKFKPCGFQLTIMAMEVHGNTCAGT